MVEERQLLAFVAVSMNILRKMWKSTSTTIELPCEFVLAACC